MDKIKHHNIFVQIAQYGYHTYMLEMTISAFTKYLHSEAFD